MASRNRSIIRLCIVLWVCAPTLSRHLLSRICVIYYVLGKPSCLQRINVSLQVYYPFKLLEVNHCVFWSYADEELGGFIWYFHRDLVTHWFNYLFSSILHCQLHYTWICIYNMIRWHLMIWFLHFRITLNKYYRQPIPTCVFHYAITVIQDTSTLRETGSCQ